ncbi:hypothetical protein U9R71_26505 [Bacillus toyonensis]|uniref:hypothetical protein n=2 Tax=Bacillus toyonensis TaxID=155322 RepID=UPI001443C0B1|nr:hypothetical protein [Bacillus toyonensis]MCU5303575.1 hypothetical protein [Bacillus toyonensis]MCU5726188.1 hypothetical protein [Bacillus toyonensis]MDD9265092.1 hypothetical protein [Bacillus toyonensis]NKW96632.1 hypothetical protein [Bacillus toyonensis]HDR7429000.1 hypothetical protein [Bacillus toyonensis]
MVEYRNTSIGPIQYSFSVPGDHLVVKELGGKIVTLAILILLPSLNFLVKTVSWIDN